MSARTLLRVSLPFLALAAASAGCSTVGHGAHGSRTTSAAVAPRDSTTPSLDELRTREAPAPLKEFRVRAADGAIELHVKASAPPTTKTHKQPDGSSYSIVSFPLGNDVEASCHANSGALDLAHWVDAVLTETHTTLVEPPTVAVEVVEGHPILFVHTDGVLEQGGVKKRHIAKFAAMHLDQGSVACVHDAVGFEATFRDLARHVARTSKTPGADRPAFRSISIARDGEQVLGFEELRMYAGPKPGEQRQIALSSGVIGTENAWTTSDTGWFGLVDAKGVVRERSVSRTGAQTDHDMTLDRKSPGVFNYEGKVKGEPKKGSFTTKGPLVTHLSRTRSLAAFARDDKRKELALLHFEEKAPEAAVREVVTHEGNGQVGLEDRGRAFHCTIDPRGLCSKRWLEGSTIVVERAYVAGSL